MSRYLIRFLDFLYKPCRHPGLAGSGSLVVVVFAALCLAAVVCVFSLVQSELSDDWSVNYCLDDMSFILPYLNYWFLSVIIKQNKLYLFITLDKHIFLCGRGWWYILSCKWILHMHCLSWWNAVFMSHPYKNINSHYTFGHHYKWYSPHYSQ